MPVVLIGACGDSVQEEATATSATVPKLGTARLGSGAGPTPIPVTPTPTATPSPTQLTLYDPVWEGTYTIKQIGSNEEITKNIVLEFNPKELIGEGVNRRRDEGAILIEGHSNWIALSYVRVDPETGKVSFRVSIMETKFDGILEGDRMTGTAVEGSVNKGTFEVVANRDKKPQRRPEAETGMG
ncbi:MAG: hypothetical protein QGF12_03115 [SAR202 cluster bacterium]|jgi:hypothetical protein|nr:hypothetical protein [SAR202 cluster bacterium]